MRLYRLYPFPCPSVIERWRLIIKLISKNTGYYTGKNWNKCNHWYVLNFISLYIFFIFTQKNPIVLLVLYFSINIGFIIGLINFFSKLTEYKSSIPGQGVGFSITPTQTQNFSKEVKAFSSLFVIQWMKGDKNLFEHI